MHEDSSLCPHPHSHHGAITLLCRGQGQDPHLRLPLLAPGPCGAYFRCRNGRCIPSSLVCDPWGMDNCGDGSDQGSWLPANCRGPSPEPSQIGSTDAHTSRPLTSSPALGSAGSLRIAAERSSPAGRDPTRQDATLECCSYSSHQNHACPSPGDRDRGSAPRPRPQ
ncbi:low-density lipoprotein receptor class A domain-containing protein 2 [Sapajus apella]|uniref:Low-density lipoprotein receptor class A domain-containing protein 2 n=1 Tax=Sapajus apella TaxID=9515 RepID=A0A6J3JNV8_SAPAP|nr:low-density lipoprotein receptor class A domain-containing protein 2 [Sapajus apella]